MQSNSVKQEARLLSLFESPGKIETGTPDATAWLARDPTKGVAVLIKCLHNIPTRARATEALTLSHPNLLAPRRWMVSEGGLFILRDVVRGKNLIQFLAASGGQTTTDILRQWLHPILDALEYAHKQGTAHGGISLENILISEDNTPILVDFATASPAAPQHVRSYNSTANVAGDIRAFGKVLAGLLPTTGAFANPVVRGRVEGIALRSETIASLRETLDMLDKIALSTPQIGRGTVVIGRPGATSADKNAPSVLTNIQNEIKREELSAIAKGVAKMVCEPGQDYTPVTPGGGGVATLTVRNDGEATLYVRMIATQHAWLNVRPMPLPLTIAPGKSAQVTFVVSAARLAAGEYRSAVYLSTNAVSAQAEDSRNGWYRHTAEIRISVGGVGAWRR
jgi:tRNA A-37 threonylcarbamoyl transferase component Bud32